MTKVRSRAAHDLRRYLVAAEAFRQADTMLGCCWALLAQPTVRQVSWGIYRHYLKTL